MKVYVLYSGEPMFPIVYSVRSQFLPIALFVNIMQSFTVYILQPPANQNHILFGTEDSQPYKLELYTCHCLP